VKLASDVSERIDQGLLDVHVDVFEFDAKRELLALDSLLDAQEFPFDLGELRVGQDPLLGQHPSMGDRSANVVLIESVVKGNAFAEARKRLIHITGENTATGWRAQGVDLWNIGEVVGGSMLERGILTEPEFIR
jgi:hypothetical protein